MLISNYTNSPIFENGYLVPLAFWLEEQSTFLLSLVQLWQVSVR